jgi:hypothetical protein
MLLMPSLKERHKATGQKLPGKVKADQDPRAGRPAFKTQKIADEGKVREYRF